MTSDELTGDLRRIDGVLALLHAFGSADEEDLEDYSGCCEGEDIFGRSWRHGDHKEARRS